MIFLLAKDFQDEGPPEFYILNKDKNRLDGFKRG